MSVDGREGEFCRRAKRATARRDETELHGAAVGISVVGRFLSQSHIVATDTSARREHPESRENSIVSSQGGQMAKFEPPPYTLAQSKERKTLAQSKERMGSKFAE